MTTIERPTQERPAYVADPERTLLPAISYSFFSIDPAWRRLPRAEKEAGRREALDALATFRDRVTTHGYSTVGLKGSADFFLWSIADQIKDIHEQSAALLATSLGAYLTVHRVMFGLVRHGEYVKRRTPQEQAVFEADRWTYMIVYPFTKTHAWYQLGKEARQGYMNEHIKIGKAHPTTRQLLVYSFGLDDQEHVVAYETEDLADFQSLVMDLREADGRPYTAIDTPIYTGIHYSLDRVLELLG